MNRRAKLFLLLILTSFFGLSEARSQTWIQLTRLGGSGLVSIYFLDVQGFPALGYAGMQDGSIWQTANYGVSWVQAKANPPIHGPITSFVFKDASHGWLTCRQKTQPGCYQTVDGGATWTALPNADWDRFCIALNPSNQRLFLTSPAQEFRTSSDNGVTWSVVGPDLMNGIAFSTPLLGVASCFSGGFRFTHDGGITWLLSPMQVECWNPLAVSPTVFFAVSEANWTVYCTTDGGNIWEPHGQLPRRPTGDIHGMCGQLYVQTDSAIFYSMDEGYTWHSIDGPGNQSDSRFYTVGTVIFAGDESGAIYKYHDDPRAPEGRISLEGPVPTILKTNCDGLDTNILIRGVSKCETTKLLGIDTARSSGGLSVVQPAGRFVYTHLIKGTPKGDTLRSDTLAHAAMPYTLLQEDTSFVPLHVRLKPSNGFDSTVITLHFLVGLYPFDTTIVLRASRDRSISLQFLGAPLQLTSKVGCQTITGTFTAINGKCDTVTVIGVRAVDSAHFYCTSKLPAIIKPYGSLPIKISASGEAADTITTKIILVTEVAGVQSELEVDAALIVQSDGPAVPGIARSINVAPVNICARRRCVVPIRDLGCNHLIVQEPHWFIPLPEVTIVQEPSWPDTIASGGTDSIVLEFAPNSVRSQTGILEFQMSSGTSSVDTMVQVQTSAYDLAKATLSSNAMEFDSLLVCNEDERFIYIRNESCKPTQLIQVVTAKDGSFISISPSVGSWIPPGDSVRALVHLKPRGSGDKHDSYSLYYRDSSGAEQHLDIALHGYIIPDVPKVTMSATSIGMDSIAPCSSRDTSIVVTNTSLCDTVTITSARMLGSEWFSVDTSMLPLKIAPGQSGSIGVRVGTTSDSFGKATLSLSGYGIDTAIYLSGSTAPLATEEVTASYASTVFHAKLCSSDTKQFFLHNRTCEPIDVRNVSLSDSVGFGFVSLPKLPFKLVAGDSMAIQILFSAEDTIRSNGTLHYETSDGKVRDTIPISGIPTTRPAIVRLGLKTMDGSNSVSRLPGDTLSLAIVPLDDESDTLGLTVISTWLQYDHDVLTLTGAAGNAGWPDPTSGSDNIHLVAVTNHSLSRNAPIAVLHFRTTFAEPRSTQVGLMKTTLNNEDVDFARCVLTASTPETISVTIFPFCNDSLMGDVLLGLPFVASAAEVRSNGGRSILHFQLIANTSAQLHLALADIRGAEVENLGDVVVMPGQQEIQLRVHQGSGAYELLVHSNGKTIARRLSVIK